MKSKDKIINRIVLWTSPPAGKRSDELRYWQERIIYSFLLFGITFGMFSMIQGLTMSIREGVWILAFFNVAIYLWIWLLFLRRSLSYYFRVLSIILVSFFVGLILMVVTGPFGAGPTWLFFFPVVTGLLLEFRWAIVAILVNVLTTAIFGWTVTNGIYRWPFFEVQPLDTWYMISLNFLLLSTIATMSIAIVVRGLQTSLNEKKGALDLLEIRNEDLKRSNLQLEEENRAKLRALASLQKSEEALLASEIRFRELIDLLPLGYFLVDAHLNVLFLNKKAQGYFGFNEGISNNGLDHQLGYFLEQEDTRKAIAKIKQGFEGHDSGWDVFAANSRQEVIFPIELCTSPVTINNQIVGVQGLIVDITDRVEKEKLKTARDIAEKTNKAISEWISFIVHEIRSPISIPLSYSKLGIQKLNRFGPGKLFLSIRRWFDRFHFHLPADFEIFVKELNQMEEELSNHNDKLISYFERISSSSDRINHLINELLELSKLESGQMEFTFQKTDVLDIVKQVSLESEAIVLEKNLTLEVIEPELNTVVECDAFRIVQLMHNLLSNAIKFTPEGKKISIGFESSQLGCEGNDCDPCSPALRITVADEGIGIPNDQLSYIFEKFKQSRKSRKGEGTGLGLPICKEIVAAHKGTISVDCVENTGSRFNVLIPYRQTMETHIG